SCGTRVPCEVAELTFLARLVLLAEWWNLCSLLVLGFPSGPGSPVRRMVLVQWSMAPCASFARESSRLFITLFLSRSIGDVDTFLTQRKLDHFCNTYSIPANLGPELPGREDTIRDALVRKIGIYTRFLEFANFCVPLSRFLLRVLEYYQINFSHLSVLGAAKVSHFKIMCRVLGYWPSLVTFRRFYVNSISNGWMSFSRRGPTPCCLSKKFDSLKNWNDHFFWIDASICPISVPWHTGASILKDPPPSDDRINAELLALLDHHRTIIKRYPETFLCLVGLSRSFNNVLVRPTLLQDDGSVFYFAYMGLLDFVKSVDPFKVKTGERTLAEGEIPLNDESVNMTVPPSVDIIQIVNHTIVDEVEEHAGKKKKKVVFEELPTKQLRSDAASASEAVPITGSKGSAALKRLELQIEPGGVGSSYVPPPVEEFVSSSVTPTPEPDADEDYGSSQDGGVRTHHASMGII
ncbi:hypothetical protein Tco_1158950, partial [Tanacetum coccineum]